MLVAGVTLVAASMLGPAMQGAPIRVTGTRA
jgi:hypothetical protein